MTNNTTSTEAQVIDISEFAPELEMIVSFALVDLDIAVGHITQAA